MSQTQRERITSAFAPLQRSYGVVAVSQKYQLFKKSRSLILCIEYKLYLHKLFSMWKYKKYNFHTIQMSIKR